MASQQSTADFLTGQMKHAGNIRSRKMFGEYAIYCDDKIVALVCDDQLYVKPTISGKEFIGTPTLAPAYPGAKPYFLIDTDRWDDDEWLGTLIQCTAKELPLPKKKIKHK